MGKHRKTSTCSVCNGSGTIKINVDKKTETRGCWGCGGSGKV